MQRVQSSRERLTAVASTLNTASDELGNTVNTLDEYLKQLNLGISSWHRYAGEQEEFGEYWARYIGYSKVGPRWGIALRRASGHMEAPPEYHNEEEWLFNDAPRQMRMEAVEYIPEMIDSLIESAESAVEKLQRKTAEAKQLAEVLAPKPKSVPRNQQSK